MIRDLRIRVKRIEENESVLSVRRCARQKHATVDPEHHQAPREANRRGRQKQEICDEDSEQTRKRSDGGNHRDAPAFLACHELQLRDARRDDREVKAGSPTSASDATQSESDGATVDVPRLMPNFIPSRLMSVRKIAAAAKQKESQSRGRLLRSASQPPRISRPKTRSSTTTRTSPSERGCRKNSLASGHPEAN